MRNMARPSALIVTLGWIAAWAGALLLMWRPGYQARLDLTGFTAAGDIASSGTARLLATVVGAIAIAIALPVLLSVFLPAATRAPERPVAHTDTPSRAHTDQMPVPAAPVRAEAPDGGVRVHQQTEAPASLRPAAEPAHPLRPVTDAGPRVALSRPVTASSDAQPPRPAAEAGDLAALNARLDRQDAEIQRLREAVAQQGQTAAARDEHDRVANGRV